MSTIVKLRCRYRSWCFRGEWTW